MIYAVACQCGSADNWVRSKLRKFNYPQSLSIPITKGKEKAKAFVSRLPQCEETSALLSHIDGSSKFAIIIGTDRENVRWVDVVNGTYIKNDVDAELIVKHFA